MSQQAKSRSYKPTLNLPKTKFGMKANLVQNEPRSLKRWSAEGLYEQIRRRPHPQGRYVFHDGPPYANGSIHLGHLLNKALKDFVVRSKTMAGYDCPYVPGWDCHGLPIEHKVVQELGSRARDMSAMQIRHRCRQAAEKYVKLQSTQMQRLLTIADYQAPYRTMDPAYEAAVLEVFAYMCERGLVYRMKKSVQWSIENETALADAELEYYDRQDTSAYVLYEIENPSRLPPSLGVPPNEPVSLMIWTTTPWTLPANMAVAVAAGARYGLFRFNHDGRYHCAVLADELGTQVLEAGGAGEIERLGGCSGRQLERSEISPGVEYRQPVTGWSCPVVTADYVTLDDGTGLVHTAPGHGADDYETGRHKCLHFQSSSGKTNVRWLNEVEKGDRHGDLPQPDIYCPVRADGMYDETAPEWLWGMLVWDANDVVMEHLRASGHLFHAHTYSHSYPHDWRGKSPIIFRATEQWFVGVDRDVGFDGASLVDRALKVTADTVCFLPEWGRNRMRGMLESRPDWCLSRQRAWGLPIPAFYASDEAPLLTPASVRAVAKKLGEHGSDYWFTAEPDALLSEYDVVADPDAPESLKGDRSMMAELRKGTDIFDVWFESGSSWKAALQRLQGDFPADLYLEGSDQHRGWFQLSLLPSLAATNQSPFKSILTHGFMVDKDGRKMSKSLGNTLEVEDLLKEFGADVCRWWVSSLNTDNDIKVDHEYFRLAGDEYRKVRNTIRFLLSNLSDFDPREHRYRFSAADSPSVDAWALGELEKLINEVQDDYEALRFRRVHDTLFVFCNETMSAVFLMATKDRLYCDSPDSPRRRRTQTAMFDIADALIRLMAPILPHTAEEAWQALHGESAVSVHIQLWPDPPQVTVDPDWEQVMEARAQWLKVIEDVRQASAIDNPLDTGLRISVPADQASFLQHFEPTDLADLCGISRVELDPGRCDADPQVPAEVLDLRDEPRCERCWKRDGTVRLRGDGGMLSDRDAEAVGV